MEMSRKIKYKMSRKIKYKRAPFQKILILCEGMTEKLYLLSVKNSLPRVLQRGIKIEIDCYKKRDPKNLVQEAIRRKSKARKECVPYSKVWIVFDHDNLPNRDFAFNKAKTAKIEIAYTSMCIELWFIIHFEDSQKHFINGDIAKKYLSDNHIKGYEPAKTRYEPAKTNVWKNLDKEKILRAYNNAESIRKGKQLDLKSGINIWDLNPYTNMDFLVKFLLER